MCQTLYDMVRLGKRANNIDQEDSCISNLMESYERLEELKESCQQNPTFECLRFVLAPLKTEYLANHKSII